MVKTIVQKGIDKLRVSFLFQSFRFRIVVTVTAIVAIIGFVSFQIFTAYLDKQLHKCNVENHLSFLTILREQYLFMMGKNGGKAIFPLLDRLDQNPKVLNILLLDSKGDPIYPYDSGKNIQNIPTILKDFSDVDSIVIREIGSKEAHFIRTFVKINNHPSCYQCHPKENDPLGYLVIDLSSEEIERNIASTKNFGRIFTFSLMIIIFTSIGILHYRYIKVALNKFIQTFQHIEQGDLSKRIHLPKRNELGELALQLNQTLDKLQQYQEKIKEYHRKELMNTQKLATIGEMAASFAHEIKNPLTGIVNALNILANDLKDPEKKAIIKEIQYQSIRVNKAINDLLQFSKPIKLCLEKNNLNQLLITIKNSLVTQIRNKKIRFTLRLDPRIPDFPFDHNQMEIVISNLVINAVQAIPSTGNITIETILNERDKVVYITIEDDGVGISEDNLTKIFKPFFTTKHQGTGLGLAIASDIIERHGGKISVKSQKNRGTKFTIELPISLI